MIINLEKLRIRYLRFKSDIIMLRHESLEAFYMNDYKMKYDNAHKLANEKYNYQEADRNG